MPTLPATTALIVIDVQKAIDDPRWAIHGPRNNPLAEGNIAALLTTWRRTGWPIVHIRHDSKTPTSTYYPGSAGHAFKPEAQPHPNELVVGKSTNNAFIDTRLDTWLTERGCATLVIVGVITNNSVEATARMAGNLGFDTMVVADACFTFAKSDRTGHLWPADQVHELSLANLDGEYARIVETKDVLAMTD